MPSSTLPVWTSDTRLGTNCDQLKIIRQISMELISEGCKKGYDFEVSTVPGSFCTSVIIFLHRYMYRPLGNQWRRNVIGLRHMLAIKLCGV